MLRAELDMRITGENDDDIPVMVRTARDMAQSPYVVLRAICMELNPKTAGPLRMNAHLTLIGEPIMAPVMLTFFALRHVKSQLLMPQMKRGRGYTHWNPDNVEETQKLYSAMQIPRLLTSKRQAQRCRQLWSQYPNASTVRYEQSMWSDEGGGEDFRTKPDGRKLDDLEIVAVHVIPNDIIKE